MESKIAARITLGQIIGETLEEEFASFDMTDIQSVLETLNQTDAIDLAHAEMLQQQSLRGADVLSEFLGKLIKTVQYLEVKLNAAKNKAALNYQAADGIRTTIDMRKWAGESDPAVEEIGMKLAKAKGSKSILEKKYDVLIKSHHHWKDIATGMKRSIGGFSGDRKNAQGWE